MMMTKVTRHLLLCEVSREGQTFTQVLDADERQLVCFTVEQSQGPCSLWFGGSDVGPGGVS